MASVEQQVAGAFHGDIGITSDLHPDEDCPPGQDACAAAISGGDPELTDDRLAAVTFYGRTLSVPAMRGADEPEVADGAELFASFGCASCHTPTLHTGASDLTALSDQEIHPYTDLLLHDMGPGLSDGRPDFDAVPEEWRTPPLWGLGHRRRRQRRPLPPARRTGRDVRGGDPVARRRGRGGGRGVPHGAGG